MKALRIIADHAAWWMLRSLHPHDLGGCETLLVLGSLPRDPSGREAERAGFLSSWFRKERVLVAQRSTLGGLDQTEKSQKRSDCQSFCSPFGDIGQSDATQSHAGKTASQAADGFCKQMIVEALAGLDVAVQAHLLTSALLGLEGDGALGAQIVARERLAQHVTRAITLRPERR